MEYIHRPYIYIGRKSFHMTYAQASGHTRRSCAIDQNPWLGREHDSSWVVNPELQRFAEE